MVRSILGVVLGFILAGIAVLAVETIGHIIYTPPIDANDPEALKLYFANAPIWVLLFVLLAWAVGSFVGGCSAAWIARRAPGIHAVIVGSLVLLSGVATMYKFWHPVWFQIAGILTPIPLAFAGSLLGRRRRRLPTAVG